MLRRTRSLVLALVLATTVPAFAQIPDKTSYQGLLLDSGGNPVTATVTLTFSIWDASACGGGALKWGPEVHAGVIVANGVFTVLLGDAGMPLTDPPIAFDVPCWLEIKVGADPALCPRIELVAVPAALMARTVEDGAITSAKIQDLTITENDIAAGAITKDKLAPGAINPSNLSLPFAATESSASTLWDLSNSGTGSAGSFQNDDATGAALFADNASTGPALVAKGTLHIGSDTEDGMVELFQSGNSTAILSIDDDSGDGGRITGRDAAGITYTIEPDGSGSGGALTIRRSATATGFLVDGNRLGSENTKVTIAGADRSMVFDTNVAGNSSVELPNDAIRAAEVLDEPGVASATSNPAVGIGLGPIASNILIRSITVPTSGYVFVVATCQAQFEHTGGAASGAAFGVSDVSATLPPNQDVAAGVANGATGRYVFPTTVQGLFSVSAGLSTFYFVGLAENSSTDVTLFDLQLTLAFFPTAYGTVAPTLTATGGEIEESGGPAADPLTVADIAAEKAEARVFHLARLQKEMDAMRAQLERLQSEMAMENEVSDDSK